MNKTQIQARSVLEEKIKSQYYQQENVEVCLCDSRDFDTFSERERYGMRMQTVICKNCGLLIQSPRLTEESLNQLYNNEYRLLYSPAHAKDPSLLFQAEEKLGQNILSYLKSSVKTGLKTGLVLDIGCGAGGALEPFRKIGWTVQGCELDQNLANYGNQNGIPISAKIIDSEGYKKSSFDVVLLNDILEHQRHPDIFLKRIYELLKPNCYIYVQFPGIRNLRKNSYPDILRDLQLAHTFYWDLKLLEYLFNKTGFKKVNGTEEIRAIFQKTESAPTSNITSVTNYYRNIRQFLTSVEKERFKLFWSNNYQLLTTRPIKFILQAVEFTKNSW